MKVNQANLQLYRIDQARTQSSQQTAKPAELNPFVRARFADLLSENERNFIAQNFKVDTTSESYKPKLGRVIDVKA
ncbi:MAG: hypothetical protein NT028_00945 [candidate division Zixibacteria bacterium]|nr:hypothetical protein [candidate division Zixibacteria bacterium]